MKGHTEGAKLRKGREADLKRRDQQNLKALALRITRATAERRYAYQQIAHYCRLGRQHISARVKRLRDEAREAINAKAEKLRAAQREQCATSQREARRELDQELARVAAELEQERKSFRNAYGRKASTRASAKERRQESDDEVRRNLPAELVAVFDQVKATIRSGPRRTRTEAFIEWAEENPDQVHAILYDQAERDVARLVAEHERVARRLRKGRKAYDDPDERAHALAGVPF